MSTPNPLIPQGSLQHSGNSNVRIAVATVLAIHVVFFGGLLLQGCKRDVKTEAGATDTNTATPATVANSSALNYPPIETNSLYYPSSNALPPENTSTAAAVPPNMPQEPLTRTMLDGTHTGTQSARDPWAQSNTPAAPGASAGMTKEYTVVRGDTYSEIAKAQGTTVAALKSANPGVEPTKIRPGMKLVVPAGAPASAVTGASSEAAGAASNGSGTSYTVKSGDNLTKIAKKHGVTVGQLRSANDLQTSMVKVGQKLKIPSGGTMKTASSNAVAPTPTF